MLVPIFLAAGYDLLVPLAVIFVSANVGALASTANPFAVIIASDAAGVDWTSGLTIRAVALVLCLVISIVYIIRYAEKVKKNPEKSLVYGTAVPEIYASNTPETTHSLKFSTKIQLFIFALTFVVMIVGVSQWGWWFQEMTGLFLVAAIVIAILQRTGEEKFIEHFLIGARDLLGVAFIIRYSQRGFFYPERRTDIRYYTLLCDRAGTGDVSYAFLTYTDAYFWGIEFIYRFQFRYGCAHYAYYGGFGNSCRGRGGQCGDRLPLRYGNDGADHTYRDDTSFADYGQCQL